MTINMGNFVPFFESKRSYFWQEMLTNPIFLLLIDYKSWTLENGETKFQKKSQNGNQGADNQGVCTSILSQGKYNQAKLQIQHRIKSKILDIFTSKRRC